MNRKKFLVTKISEEKEYYSTWTKKEKQQLIITTDVILTKELYYNTQVLQNLNISANRIRQAENEIGKLLHNDTFTNATNKIH